MSLADLQRLAGAMGFRAETIEKVLLLLGLLDAIRAHPYTGPRVALKGGTALNLFALGVPRLSVDIDLNYVGAVDRATMQTERPDVERGLHAACERSSLTVKRVPTDHAGGKWRLSFVAGAGGTGTLELDVNHAPFPALAHGDPVILRAPRNPDARQVPDTRRARTRRGKARRAPRTRREPRPLRRARDPALRDARYGEAPPRVRSLRRCESCRLAHRRRRGGHDFIGGRDGAAPPDAPEVTSCPPSLTSRRGPHLSWRTANASSVSCSRSARTSEPSSMQSTTEGRSSPRSSRMTNACGASSRRTRPWRGRR
ncbi:MAG: nucleotidyl transferase AbiEii/AbiGii toxin family protein [Holophagales bacterium]|nr:nucleotidyl transferase AbiEii/AbiGii toxin family protein [Holophagales bacterium]